MKREENHGMGYFYKGLSYVAGTIGISLYIDLVTLMHKRLNYTRVVEEMETHMEKKGDVRNIVTLPLPEFTIKGGW
ncbi:hypothetical protein SADUNF_Sadunf05G0111400 [Salix dunnii]|uniref:Uncharacterized protein n=1 Tax=Salix dunnii TaxID=1413687 RepID=A0A835MXF1_9ROSI|nr:hypothetical protein SADUNF_Sadunf05G0111400 [Salix dunnii]